ncbi:MAG: response regulator [Magnetococcales bacterium]|nr:response regulator [Magnetococcales bacterium]
MQDPFRSFFGGCQSPTRFLLGLTLIGIGETALTVLLTPLLGGTALSFSATLLHFFSMTAWNLAIILIFFHLPLYRELMDRQWIHSIHLAMSLRMRDVTTTESLAERTLLFLIESLDALNGVVYLSSEDRHLHWLTGIGTPADRNWSKRLAFGEGILGQVAMTRKSVRLTDLPIEPLRVHSELVTNVPHDLLVIPLIHDDQLQGILALGARTRFQHRHVCFLERAEETIARALAGVRAHSIRQKLLDESRRKTEELAINQQVLRDTIVLLEQTSGFKSRFLANMSHELRSPLNSLLILAQLLKENKHGNLTAKQIEYASTIHAAGSDLLTMIDEILDLARIEAGRISIFKEPVKLADLATNLERLFTHVAREKRLSFEVLQKGLLPVAIRTDRMRVEQILKNLITNAIKFTQAGSVTVTFRAVKEEGRSFIAMSVADTGVGIPKEQQSEVFEPFRQLDDGINRKYGGTGLGLAICKELTQLLGGRIELTSEEGRGSLFTFLLPAESAEIQPIPALHHTRPEERVPGNVEGIPDDRRRLGPDDHAILLVGIDYHHMRSLSEATRSQGFGVVVAGDQSAALFLANFLRPVGLILVGNLPGVAALPMIERLKTTANRQSLPTLYLHPANAAPTLNVTDGSIRLHPMTRTHDSTLEACQHFLNTLRTAPPPPLDEPPALEFEVLNTTPVQAPRTPQTIALLSGRRILLVDEDIRNVFALTSLLEEQGCQVNMAENGREALQILQKNPLLDMILLDILLSDMNGYELLGEIRHQPAWREIPILVVTGKAMHGERQRCLEAGASDYLSKPVDSAKLLSMMRPWLVDKNR